MFLTKNKKIRYTPAYPLFYTKVGLKGVFIARTCFLDELHNLIANLLSACFQSFQTIGLINQTVYWKADWKCHSVPSHN